MVRELKYVITRYFAPITAMWREILRQMKS